MMTAALNNMHLALPEMIILIMACVGLLAEVFLRDQTTVMAVEGDGSVAVKVPSVKKKTPITYYFTQLALIFAGIATYFDYSGTVQSAFGGLFIEDKMALVLKEFIYFSAFMSFLYGQQYVKDRDMPSAEYYILGLISVLGMMVLVSASNLLTLYLGLEIMSLPIYAMVALNRNSWPCLEAGMKYFVIGALASGLLLYGMSLLFGVAKSLDLTSISIAVNNLPAQQSMILMIALVFILAGVLFKLGAAPFHMWVPDIYAGAPMSVTLFLSAAPKIAAFALAVRLLHGAVPGLVIASQQILVVVAILSMGIGNIVAIVQSNLKRMLAYSSIAHMGYMILGLIAATPSGYASAMFYVISYSVMTLGAFGMLTLMSKAGIEVESISDLAGLSRRDPWMAFMMMIIMFSMAGIPPLVGFMAKLGVLESIVAIHMTWLAVVALLFAIVGAYYYINVIKVMYFEEAKSKEPLVMGRDVQIAMAINGLGVLMLGVFPGALFSICHSAF